MRKLLETINQEPAGIAFVVDGSGCLCGVVTDGDFRRMLLAGRSLDEQLQPGDLRDFVFAKQGQTVDELLRITNKKVRIIPIVDEDGKPIDYFRYEHRVNIMPVAEPDLKGNEFKYLSDAFLSTWISSRGKYIDEFEAGFSKYCGVKYGIATANGTVAIHLALLALGIGPGDEVIVPDLTFAATINTVLHSGATPVIVDIDPVSWCIDPREIKKAITSRTRAIIPVHLYGQPCDMDSIMDIAREKKLFVIEDCAEAHGARYKGKAVGSFGDISCFSFFGNKIITTGEGGICLTSSAELDERMRVLRDHGMSKNKRYWHDLVGYNYRMTNLQAAIGVAQLERIDSIIRERKQVESGYRNILDDLGLITWQKDFNGNERVVWLVSILVQEKREQLFEALRDSGVDYRPFFYPLSEMEIYKPYVFSAEVSAKISAAGLNLPTISGVDFEKVGKAFKSIA
jgi:perosamine synthetase